MMSSAQERDVHLALPFLLFGLALGSSAACHEEAEPSRAAEQALMRARRLYAEEKPFEAIDEAQRAVELAPGWAEAQLSLGKLLLTYSAVRFSTATIDRGRLAEAITHLERACELDAKNPDAAYWCGSALAKADRYADAERRLESALALDPEHGAARKTLGLILAEQGDARRAIEALTRARTLLPRDAEIPLQLGLQLETEGRLEEARDAYLASCELNHGNPGPRSALAVLYGRLGDPGSAERMRLEFERCRAFGKRFTAASQNFEEHGRDPAACMGLAGLYLEMGIPDEAQRWAERALRLDPQHAPAIELLSTLGSSGGAPPQPAR
jgi:Flp pilus assembly protein TadD